MSHATRLSPAWRWFVRIGVPVSGPFYMGALGLAVSVVSLGIGLLRAR
jgi:hypothetical protein